MKYLHLLFWIILLTSNVKAQVNFTSSNLPIISIDTDGQSIQDIERIVAHMSITYKEAQTSNVNDPANVYDGRINIETRGSSSQFFPKKSYGLETQLPDGENNNVSLLGMPEENDWILYAPFSDKSLMRNVFAYHIANQMGRYASRTKFCELVINGEYKGIYVLMEKLKRDKNRIDIAKLKEDEIEGEDLTGGYILKIDKPTGSGGEGWASDYPPPYNDQRQIFFQYEYPESGEIIPEQADYIEDFIRAFEDNLQSENFADSLEGYHQYIDTESFIDYMIVNEVCKNVDGFRLSTFLYKQKDSNGGKLHIGPVWDFNISLGNADYCQGEFTTGWIMDFNQICTGDNWLIPFWWERLLEDVHFRQRAAERWLELRNGLLETDVLLEWIDNQRQLLGDAQVRNFQKWDILNQYIWPNNHIGGNYVSEVVYLKNWLTDRLDWLDFAFEDLGKPNPEDILGIEPIKANPNPFSEFLQWTFQATKGNLIRIELADITGKVVGNWTFVINQTGQNTVTWELAETMLPNGLYVYRYFNNRREMKREMILKY